MERKVAKLLAVTGIVASGAVALTPLTSYARYVDNACDPSKWSTLTNADGWGVQDFTTGACAADSSAKKVAVNVESSISLEAVSGAVIEAHPHSISTGDISAKVTSTHPYTISLSATTPSLVKTDNNNLTIPARNNFTKEDDAWGVKKQNATTYSALTSSPVVYYTSEDPGNGTVTNIEAGVAVTEVTSPGVYQTSVTVTAAIRN